MHADHIYTLHKELSIFKQFKLTKLNFWSYLDQMKALKMFLGFPSIQESLQEFSISHLKSLNFSSTLSLLVKCKGLKHMSISVFIENEEYKEEIEKIKKIKEDIFGSNPDIDIQIKYEYPRRGWFSYV